MQTHAELQQTQPEPVPADWISLDESVFDQ
jgi:hypothetical protein